MVLTPTVHGTYKHLVQKISKFLLYWTYDSTERHNLTYEYLSTGENNGFGLKSMSEEDLEVVHKHFRLYREKLARKTNKIDNFRDVQRR